MNIFEKIRSGVYQASRPDNFNNQEQRDAYRKAQRHLDSTVFKKDALEEVGLAGHPKADKAFAMAWERGHSSSLFEVFYELEELANLLL